MIAVDSSVLLRYLLQDDADQGRAAAEFFETKLSSNLPGFISAVVLLEMIWVARRAYKLSAEAVADTVGELLDSPNLVVEHSPVIRAALSTGPDHLADTLVHELGRRAGCSETVTFDRRFARLPGVRLLEG